MDLPQYRCVPGGLRPGRSPSRDDFPIPRMPVENRLPTISGSPSRRRCVQGFFHPGRGICAFDRRLRDFAVECKWGGRLPVLCRKKGHQGHSLLAYEAKSCLRLVCLAGCLVTAHPGLFAGQACWTCRKGGWAELTEPSPFPMCAGVATAARPITSPSISSDMGIEARRFVMQSLRVCLCRDPVPATSPVRDDPTNIL